MSSPTVYLSPGMSGKLLFVRICVYNGHNALLLRNNTSIELNTSLGLRHSKWKQYNIFNYDDTVQRFGPYDKTLNPNQGYVLNAMRDFFHGKSKDKPKVNDFKLEFSKMKPLDFDLICKLLEENFEKYSYHVLDLDEYSIFDHVDYSKSRILIPYRRTGIERTFMHLLYERGSFISYKDAENIINNFLHKIELSINKVKNLSYELLDISDKNVYKNLGFDMGEFEYDEELSTFKYGDPKIETMTYERSNSKMCVKFARKYVDRNKKYLTSLFPNIVV